MEIFKEVLLVIQSCDINRQIRKCYSNAKMLLQRVSKCSIDVHVFVLYSSETEIEKNCL